ncbi:MAG: bile acid:sodium symporter family protein [Microscillaceae bacterium]|nr:bile acid:sodium symporter family protein [Microscillaceae bacterium]
MSIDQVKLHFSSDDLLILNFCLGFIMFGVALDLKLRDFKEILYHPKIVGVGLFSQLILLPALTLLLVFIFKPQTSLALGMILVAACPGGNVSNFLSQLSKANIALSVCLTSISTLLCAFTTPLNFVFWSSWIDKPESLAKMIHLDFWKMAETIVLLIIIPLIIGLFFVYYLPVFTQKIQKPIKNLSLIIFGGFLVVAFYSNLDIILKYIYYVAFLVLIHNGVALAGGYYFSKIFKLSERDARTISIETGIQNSGLGLALIFNFFDGLGGMTLIAAWWGIWHLISGLALATFWSRRKI